MTIMTGSLLKLLATKEEAEGLLDPQPSSRWVDARLAMLPSTRLMGTKGFITTRGLGRFPLR
jgi:hypothetical protein